MIYTPNAARFVRQKRLDDGPFSIAEFVAHDSEVEVELCAGRYHQSANPISNLADQTNLG